MIVRRGKMKRVRVCKEMPFAKVGEVHSRQSNDMYKFNTNLGVLDIPELTIRDWIKDGWIEWVAEEKSLEEKIDVVLCQHGCVSFKVKKPVAQIAKEHYLEAFDKASETYVDDSELSWPLTVDKIRKAIEEA